MQIRLGPGRGRAIPLDTAGLGEGSFAGKSVIYLEVGEGETKEQYSRHSEGRGGRKWPGIRSRGFWKIRSQDLLTWGLLPNLPAAVKKKRGGTSVMAEGHEGGGSWERTCRIIIGG